MLAAGHRGFTPGHSPAATAATDSPLPLFPVKGSPKQQLKKEKSSKKDKKKAKKKEKKEKKEKKRRKERKRRGNDDSGSASDSRHSSRPQSVSYLLEPAGKRQRVEDDGMSALVSLEYEPSLSVGAPLPRYSTGAPAQGKAAARGAGATASCLLVSPLMYRAASSALP